VTVAPISYASRKFQHGSVFTEIPFLQAL
jgi:hypothetical protein